jgi:hypothetical protein
MFEFMHSERLFGRQLRALQTVRSGGWRENGELFVHV